jgi:hypothetical protein
MGDIDTDARAQLGNVLSVLPQKLHRTQYDSSYDFVLEIPPSKNMLSLDDSGTAWISSDNPNAAIDGNLYLWKKVGGVGGGATTVSSEGITLSGVGDGVGSGTGYIDSLFLDIETDPNGLELIRLPGKNPTLQLSKQISQSSNELIIEWDIPVGFRKGVVEFPSSFNIPSDTSPTVFTQFIAYGDPTPSYLTTISNISNVGFTLEMSAEVSEAGQSLNILVKTNEPLPLVGVPELPTGWDWFIVDTEAELISSNQSGQLDYNSIYYVKDMNRMYILSSETGELVYYQGSPL